MDLDRSQAESGYGLGALGNHPFPRLRIQENKGWLGSKFERV
jgi:hypothetical protein